MSEPGLSNGVIILAIAIVVGCFAVLWPKIFSPMLFGEPVINTKPIDEGEFTLKFFNFPFIHSALISVATFLVHECLRGNSEFLFSLHLLRSNSSKSVDKEIPLLAPLSWMNMIFVFCLKYFRFYSILLKSFPFFLCCCSISNLIVKNKGSSESNRVSIYIMHFKLIS
jgi:hypothetical protein